MLNITQIPAPRVPVIDGDTKLMTVPWFRYFNNINTIVGGGTGVVPPSSGGTGTNIVPLSGQILIGNATGTYTVAYLTASTGLFRTNGDGSLAVGISNTGVLASSYGSASSVGTFTVNAQGQLTSAVTTPIAISATQITSGLLAIARGGTNSSATPTNGGISYGTGAAYAFSAAGTASQILLSGGAASPTWANQSSLSVGTATNLAGGAAGSLPYQSGAGSTTFLATGSNGQVLTLTAGVPSWTTPTTGTVTSVSFTGGLITVATATTTPALTVAGTSGGVPYFSSASTWASSAVLASNALMIGGGAGAAPATTTTGTGVLTALGTNIGTAGSFVVNGGALGTPSSGTVTNLTGTASININGTVGATTPAAGAFTSLSATSQLTLTNASNYNLYASGAGANFMQGKLGIGVVPAASTITLLGGNLVTGAATVNNIIVNGSIQSDVTATYTSYGSNPTTAATAFTLTNLRHFVALQQTLGAGSTVTNQFGFYAFSSLTGATNNYGFYGNIASGTGRWNFYAAGTAANYFAGNVGIGTTTNSGKLDVTGGNVYNNTTATGSTGYYTNNGTVVNAFSSDFNANATYLDVNGNLYFRDVNAGYVTRFAIQSGVVSLGGFPGSEALRATPVASSVNYINVQGAATGTSPSILAAGTDANINIKLTPQGTGVLQFGTYTAGILAQTGYITITDAGGTSRRLLVG